MSALYGICGPSLHRGGGRGALGGDAQHAPRAARQHAVAASAPASGRAWFPRSAGARVGSMRFYAPQPSLTGGLAGGVDGRGGRRDVLAMAGPARDEVPQERGIGGLPQERLETASHFPEDLRTYRKLYHYEDAELKIRTDNVTGAIGKGWPFIDSVDIIKGTSKGVELLQMSEEEIRKNCKLILDTGVEHDSIKMIFLHNPSVLLDPHRGLLPMLGFMQEEMNVTMKKLSKVYKVFPLLSNIEVHEMEDKLEHFKEYNIYGPDYGRMVCKFPQLLGLHWDTTIEPKLDYLQSIGFSDMHQLGKMVVRFPQLLGLNVQRNIHPTLRFLQNDMGINREEALKMLSLFPALVGHNVESNLQPKWKFVKKELGGDASTLRPYPQYFSYSLVYRIAPRYAWLKHHGLYDNTTNRSMKLSQNLSKSDVNFVASYGKTLAEYYDFRSEWMEREDGGLNYIQQTSHARSHRGMARNTWEKETKTVRGGTQGGAVQIAEMERLNGQVPKVATGPVGKKVYKD